MRSAVSEDVCLSQESFGGSETLNLSQSQATEKADTTQWRFVYGCSSVGRNALDANETGLKRGFSQRDGDFDEDEELGDEGDTSGTSKLKSGNKRIKKSVSKSSIKGKV